MPKYVVTVERYETYREELIIEAQSRDDAWGKAEEILSEGLAFDGEVLDGDEYVTEVSELNEGQVDPGVHQ
jgi:hypothetical protein